MKIVLTAKNKEYKIAIIGRQSVFTQDSWLSCRLSAENTWVLRHEFPARAIGKCSKYGTIFEVVYLPVFRHNITTDFQNVMSERKMLLLLLRELRKCVFANDVIANNVLLTLIDMNIHMATMILENIQ